MRGIAPASSAARIARLVAGASLGVALAGCSWFGKDEKPPAPLPDFRSAANAQIAWQQSLDASGVAGFSPVGAGGAVFAAAPDGTLASFDAASGRPNWRIKAGSKLSAGVGAEGDTIVVGTSKGDVLAFDRSGKPKWTSKVSSEVLGPPRISEATTVVWSGDGNVFGLATADGARRWVLQRTMPALSVRNQAGGILARGGVAGQVDAFVIVQNIFAIGEMEVVARHGSVSRDFVRLVLASRSWAVTAPTARPRCNRGLGTVLR
jgi:outer membrane protein assembly factor BamB